MVHVGKLGIWIKNLAGAIFLGQKEFRRDMY